MTDTLLDQVRTTEAARREYIALKDVWYIAVGNLHHEYRDLLEQVAERKHQVEVAEENLRALALAEFDRTKQKKVAPGVSIALLAEVVYEKRYAEAWATEKQLALVPAHLDVKEFERIVKGMSNLPSFVEVRYRPTVRLDTDLGAALAASEVPPIQELV